MLRTPGLSGPKSSGAPSARSAAWKAGSSGMSAAVEPIPFSLLTGLRTVRLLIAVQPKTAGSG